MSNELQQESISHIANDLRRLADTYERQNVYDLHLLGTDTLRVFADRLDAAAIDDIAFALNVQHGLENGNAAAMREALKRVLAAYKSGAIHTCAECYRVEWDDELGDLKAAVEAVLAASVRNCDLPLFSEVSTSNPADAAWRAFRECHPGAYLDVPGLLLCINWLLAPAEGGVK
jgi:hypothetical protein